MQDKNSAWVTYDASVTVIENLTHKKTAMGNDERSLVATIRIDRRVFSASLIVKQTDDGLKELKGELYWQDDKPTMRENNPNKLPKGLLELSQWFTGDNLENAQCLVGELNLYGSRYSVFIGNLNVNSNIASWACTVVDVSIPCKWR